MSSEDLGNDVRVSNSSGIARHIGDYHRHRRVAIHYRSASRCGRVQRHPKPAGIAAPLLVAVQSACDVFVELLSVKRVGDMVIHLGESGALFSKPVDDFRNVGR